MQFQKINARWLAFISMVAIIGSVVVLPFPSVEAQDPAVTLPSIITFYGDLSQPLTVNAVEAADQPLTLAWQVVGMRDGDRLGLDSYHVNQWESLLPVDAAPLDVNGSMVITIRHPLNFGRPMYRLSVIDGGGTVIEERIITLPYDVSQTAGPPQISRFTVENANVSPVSLADGSARIMVGWAVANRLPTTNLIFEQVLPDGQEVSIELPRAFLWIPSIGQGEVAPIPPPTENVIRLRVRLVDVTTNNTLHERHLTLPIGDQNTDMATIQEFVAEPGAVERGGQITVTWSVSGAEVVLVGQVDADGSYIEPDEPLPSVGSLTFTALDNDYYTASFFIYAGDDSGNGTTTTTSVEITCPYTYFFGDIEAVAGTCPLTETLTMPAAHQQFERGDMIWRSDLDQIIAVYSDGTFERFDDTFEEDEEVEYPVDESDIPADLLIPIRGFGKVWANNDHVRSQLGWAQLAEIGYETMVQRVADGKLGRDFSDEYFTMPNGQVIELKADGTWQQVSVAISGASQ